jgi:hypothetical protein
VSSSFSLLLCDPLDLSYDDTLLPLTFLEKDAPRFPFATCDKLFGRPERKNGSTGEEEEEDTNLPAFDW